MNSHPAPQTRVGEIADGISRLSTPVRRQLGEGEGQRPGVGSEGGAFGDLACLSSLPPLFAATDFYIWDLYRRDLGGSRAFITARMTDLVNAATRRFGR